MALSNAVRYGNPMATIVPDPGRANVVVCSRYLPRSDSSCDAAADPRDAGMATGGGS